MKLTSSAFQPGEPIPARYTCEGENVAPPLELHEVPTGAGSLALIVDDPDGPRDEPWVHWLLWDLPVEVTSLAERHPTDPGYGTEGTNDFKDVGYGGPCPPPGHGSHRYRFHAYALDQQLKVPQGAPRAELEKAMQGRILDEAELVGTFER